MFRWLKIRKYERGFLFRNQEFDKILRPGRHFVWGSRSRVRVVSVRDVWLPEADLDVIVRAGVLEGDVRVLNLQDHERALVWVDGRFDSVRGPGLSALWTVFHTVRAEIVDARTGRFDHAAASVILQSKSGQKALEVTQIEEGTVALLKVDGRQAQVLKPGRYAFWRGVARYEVQPVDLREQAIDVAGQELMTADNVTLRINAVVAVRVVDPVRAMTAVDNFAQALYRESQLALRATVGAMELEAFLSEKERVATELAGLIRTRAEQFGLEVTNFGIKDVILPGDMKAILNRVTEARKAAEADLITRREETAAMRSQANTARIFESNPALMRLRELEVLEKVAGKANLNVVLGEQGLTDRIVKLL